MVEVAEDGHGYRVTRWNGWFVGFPQDLAALAAMLGRSGVRLEDLAEEHPEMGP